MGRRGKVMYYYEDCVGDFYYAPGHPMKPHRIRMTHALVSNYGLYKKLDIFRPRYLTALEMTKFHTDDYINFLQAVTPKNMVDMSAALHRFNVGEDTPVFDGIFTFSQISAGGSVGAAVQLNQGTTDTVINWAGGLHHAKKAEAAGFCYVNDCVLAILELLKYHQRVLYIDIDIHHGDGVEEAFYTTDRVMTVSFHKFGDFFPGTGHLRDVGAGAGKYYSLNYPMKDGINDECFQSVFRPVMQKVMDTFQPDAVVLQCGADSLTGDRLGCFNLSLKGHAQCVSFIKSFSVPLLVLGGGGYTVRNVARCWAYETSVLLDTPVSPDIPFNEYYEYFGPDYNLHLEPSNMDNLNDHEYLEKTTIEVLENLRQMPCAPSVQMHTVPPDSFSFDYDEDQYDPDVRENQYIKDKKIERDDEFYDSDGEGEKDRTNHKDVADHAATQKETETEKESATAEGKEDKEEKEQHDGDGDGNGAQGMDVDTR